jgi:hypothetical protein
MVFDMKALVLRPEGRGFTRLRVCKGGNPPHKRQIPPSLSPETLLRCRHLTQRTVLATISAISLSDADITSATSESIIFTKAPVFIRAMDTFPSDVW